MSKQRSVLSSATEFAKSLSPVERRAFDVDTTRPDGKPYFIPLGTPKSGDWLAEHPTNPQTVEAFRPCMRRLAPGRNKIYLLPLGDFPAGESPPLDLIKEYVRAFYGNVPDVTMLPVVDIDREHITSRIHYGHKQIYTKDVFQLLKRSKPSDAFCVLGITMLDLYPDPSWNFVFGQASTVNGYGVFSFARFDPRFYDAKAKEPREAALLRRSLKVCVHEIGHMFGVEHCTFMECIMQGSNHMDESDGRPMHLCPVDLRKFQLACGFDLVERYKMLFEFFKKYNDRDVFAAEIKWVSDMLQHLTAGPAAAVDTSSES